MQAGDKAAACTSFKTSRAETASVLDLLKQQREQILIATADAATALGRANQNDVMQGTWLGLQSQLDQRIAATCENEARRHMRARFLSRRRGRCLFRPTS
jgi:prophage antirepressor-like protein